MSADNQQESLKTVGWVVGFVEGEGTFSISIFRNKTSKLGWQVFPEFVVTQNASGRVALEKIKDFFRCGHIYINNRYDNHREAVYRYCVRNVKDIKEKILPTFRRYPLVTSKKLDLELFEKALQMIECKQHLTNSGLRKLADIAQQMNRQKPSTFLESSETIRQTPTMEMI